MKPGAENTGCGDPTCVDPDCAKPEHQVVRQSAPVPPVADRIAEKPKRTRKPKAQLAGDPIATALETLIGFFSQPRTKGRLTIQGFSLDIEFSPTCPQCGGSELLKANDGMRCAACGSVVS